MRHRAAVAIQFAQHSLIFALALAFYAALLPGAGHAQVLKRGVQGGIAGALIGGIVGGGSGKSIGTGAAIGAGVGVVAGAVEADANAKRAYRYSAAPPGGPNLVADTQAALTRLGYNPGPVDGVYGPATADAISQYQYAYRLPADGRPSPQLLDHMIHHGG
jgi:hypothetical protein